MLIHYTVPPEDKNKKHKPNRLIIKQVKTGFSGVVFDANYTDSHRPMQPFGMKWGRGLLIKGNGYLEAVTDDYHSSHSQLKKNLDENEKSRGTFYFGYDLSTKTLYLEYASDRMFEFDDPEIIHAIMNSLKNGREPFNDFIIEKDSIQAKKVPADNDIQKDLRADPQTDTATN